jgi:hypothetical protein
LTESVACASWTDSPSTSVIWVAPKEIAHWSFMWDFLNSVERANVVKGINAGGKATMQAKDLVVDKGSERKVVKEVGKIFPDVGVAILSKTLIVKAVDLSDLSGFVVATEDGQAFWEANLHANKEGNGFDRVIAAIDVVP